MKLEFSQTFPKEAKPPIRAAINKWRRCIPGLNEVYIALEDDVLGGAKTSPQPEYRRTTIKVSADFLQYDARRQEEYLRHELAHYIVAPLMLMVEGMLPKESPALIETFWRTLEGVTEDISYAMAQSAKAGLTKTTKKVKLRDTTIPEEEENVEN